MKKLLLSLGAIASVAAPVAAVVACGSKDETNKYGEFDKDVKAYQALQVMGWSNSAGIHVNVAPAGTTWDFLDGAATVFKPASKTAAIKSGPLTSSTNDKATANTLLPKVKSALSKVLETYKNVTSEIISADQDAVKSEFMIDAGLVYAAANKASATFAEVNTEVEKLAAKFVDADGNAFTDKDAIETTTVVKDASGNNLTAKEETILKTGVPLVLKLVKTVEGLKAIAQA